MLPIKKCCEANSSEGRHSCCSRTFARRVTGWMGSRMGRRGGITVEI